MLEIDKDKRRLTLKIIFFLHLISHHYAPIKNCEIKRRIAI